MPSQCVRANGSRFCSKKLSLPTKKRKECCFRTFLLDPRVLATVCSLLFFLGIFSFLMMDPFHNRRLKKDVHQRVNCDHVVPQKSSLVTKSQIERDAKVFSSFIISMRKRVLLFDGQSTAKKVESFKLQRKPFHGEFIEYF